MACNYTPLARPIVEWVDPKKLLPYTDDLVLVVISGETKDVVFDNGIALALYNAATGEWALTEFADAFEGVVHYWSPLPEAPEKGRYWDKSSRHDWEEDEYYE